MSLQIKYPYDNRQSIVPWRVSFTAAELVKKQLINKLTFKITSKDLRIVSGIDVGGLYISGYPNPDEFEFCLSNDERKTFLRNVTIALNENRDNK